MQMTVGLISYLPYILRAINSGNVFLSIPRSLSQTVM